MENRELQILEASLRQRIDKLISQLGSFVSDAGLSGAVGGGVWVLEKYVSGAVMYRPHNEPQEESIDVELTVDVKEDVKEAKVSVWLMWSHGPVIKTYVEDRIEKYGNLAELAKQLSELLDSLQNSFLEDMQREMQITRPPVYR